MSDCDRLGPYLDAYFDGELRGLRRWQVRRHLGGCTACSERLAEMEPLGVWIREAVGTASSPDLWGALEQRLPLRVSAPAAARPRRLLRPIFAMPALGATLAAALVAMLTLGGPADWPLLVDATPQTIVRSLNTHGRPVMVLDGPDDATIIWLMEEDRGDAAEESMSVWI
jgi:anti-sigma factor RsiW